MRTAVTHVLIFTLLAASGAAAASPRVAVVRDDGASPRVLYGVEKLDAALREAGVPLDADQTALRGDERHVVVGRASAGEAGGYVQSGAVRLDPAGAGREGYVLTTAANGDLAVIGGDDSGVLYGCLDLAARVRAAKGLPGNLSVAEHPAMKLRGPCIGMQKTYILPGRHVYEYPYTPELFPFFYDKQFWAEYLDFLAANRMNTLYLWSGHPFASLVKLPDYPYALEVDEATYQENVEMFRYIATEADKRGIYVVQMFYNILVSKPFAEHNHIETQLDAPTPLTADYTRKSVAEFVKQYPNVGLMLCLGEALKGIDNQRQWLDEVILPSVKDGMAAAGLKDEPPVIVRTHATDLRQIMPDALKVYHNLYTEAKYSGESLTTDEPRGKWQGIHQAMSRLGSTHLMNVHILSNLEPFRYGDVRFIRSCVKAGLDRLGAKGLHLYPLCYWDWPDAPDATTPPLKQISRDWIWYEAWARYAWNPDRDEKEDHAFWIDRIASRYGAAAAEDVLAAYDDSGECAPRLIRRFGITEGNRQTLSLGMTLDQLVHPEKYNELPDLWESDAPPGERLNVYVDREWKHLPHEGETPVSISNEVLDYSAKAVAEIDAAEPKATGDREEFERLRNDVHSIRAMSQNYCAKAKAAMFVLRYDHSHDVADMEQARVALAESLDHYRELVALTDKTYRFANSMQTGQRKIPVPGGSKGQPANYLWSQLLPRYEKELTDFTAQVDAIKAGGAAVEPDDAKPLPKMAVGVTGSGESYTVAVGAKPFTDRDVKITALAPELVGASGVRVPFAAARAANPPPTIETAMKAQVLIGYFRSDDPAYLKPPRSEFDAAAAERGGTEPLIRNAAVIEGMPPIDVYALNVDGARRPLDVGGPGAYVVLGVVPQSAPITKRDAKLIPTTRE